MPLSMQDRAAERQALIDHEDEVTEIQDTDALVRSIVAEAVAKIALCGRTLPSPHHGKHRYSELVRALVDTFDDNMPAPREQGDDPWA